MQSLEHPKHLQDLAVKTSMVSILHSGIRPVPKSWRKQSLSYEPRSRRSWGWFPFLLYKWDLKGLQNLQNRQHKGVGFPAARYKQFLTEDPEAEFLEGRREPLIPFSWKVLLVLVHHLFKERGKRVSDDAASLTSWARHIIISPFEVLRTFLNLASNLHCNATRLLPGSLECLEQCHGKLSGPRQSAAFLWTKGHQTCQAGARLRPVLSHWP